MTNEQFNKAKIIHKDIKELENFRTALDSPYRNIIKAADYYDDNDVSKTLELGSYPTLEKLIKQEVNKMISDLQKEFEQI